jgi:hypothetical protein
LDESGSGLDESGGFDEPGVVGTASVEGGFWIDGEAGAGGVRLRTIVFLGMEADAVSITTLSPAFSVLTAQPVNIQMSASARRVDFTI